MSEMVNSSHACMALCILAYSSQAMSTPLSKMGKRVHPLYPIVRIAYMFEKKHGRPAVLGDLKELQVLRRCRYVCDLISSSLSSAPSFLPVTCRPFPLLSSRPRLAVKRGPTQLPAGISLIPGPAMTCTPSWHLSRQWWGEWLPTTSFVPSVA